MRLDGFVVWRQRADTSPRQQGLLAVSALSYVCAMLCKPSAAALPIVALVIDRVALGTSWRKAAAVATAAAAVAIPFVWTTRSVQAIPTAAQSHWWQRPFVAGDALAFYLFKMNQPDRARQVLSTATQMAPNSPTPLYNQANALAAVGHFDKAEEAFRRCISLAPTLADAHTRLGIVFAETHRLGEALGIPHGPATPPRRPRCTR